MSANQVWIKTKSDDIKNIKVLAIESQPDNGLELLQGYQFLQLHHHCLITQTLPVIKQMIEGLKNQKNCLAQLLAVVRHLQKTIDENPELLKALEGVTHQVVRLGLRS